MFRLYEHKEPEAIEWVLRTWRKRSPFWPSQSDLDALFSEYGKINRQKQQAADIEENRKTRERLAKEGLPHGPEQFNGLMAKLKDMVKGFPVLTATRRMELKERIAKFQAEKKKSA